MEYSGGETSTFCRPEVSASPCVWCAMYIVPTSTHSEILDYRWELAELMKVYGRRHNMRPMQALHVFWLFYKWLSLACSRPPCPRNEILMRKFGLHSMPTLIAIVIRWWRKVSTPCYSTRKRNWDDIVNFLLVCLNTLVVVSKNSRITLNPVSQRNNSENLWTLKAGPPWGYLSHLWS